ncbi:alpha/beta-hydrolase [Aspergillus heteromorphus CBS 117.55]|uniref:Carboxylic ester hydrolase n=1 Tax=Aspergillus heteromorphus CBS 117.55 TaxID=1448321 RepID=A0A317V8J3_9EURO|nr:alpha/beta-hydrolase [Aspergillus heteromorphus CBS 117.55]PWY68390.1 alpha/beta-hydrolase [Aspergillus heteromorphus CBS 117.55]
MASFVRQQRGPDDADQAPAAPRQTPLEVLLPSHTVPSFPQRVIGRKSPIPGVEEFRGIPYGIVPARWQHALLRDRLPDDVFHATRNGPRCPQPQEPNNSDDFQSYLEFPRDVSESEFDCLNLFITRPSATTLAAAGFDARTVNLPVYVYIHGGAYSFGAGTDPMWDPARLVLKSVALKTPMIVATVNYRLNMFGFAASSEIIQAQPEGQKRGCNFGLTDQRIALRWVHQNIRAFGGDPRRITVGGQSAGGSSSHAHVLEAILGKREPLVQRGIVQSGAVGVLGPISMELADARWAAFCRHLGAPEGDAAAHMAFMAAVAPADILRAHHELGRFACPLAVDDLTISLRPNSRWNVHLDGQEGPAPEEVPANDDTVIAVLIGDTDVEGMLHSAAVGEIKTFDQLHERLEVEVQSTEFLRSFYETYGLQSNMSKTDLHERALQFLTDIQFGYHVQRSREELIGWEGSSERNARPTVVQSFRMRVGNPFPGPAYGKAHHCVDLIYIYDCFAEALRQADTTLPADSVSNAALVDRVQADWIRFITAPSVSSQAGFVTVYGQDRTAASVDMASDQEWVERKGRLNFLERNQLFSAQAIKALAGGGHVF